MAKEQVFLQNGEVLDGLALERGDFAKNPEYMHGTVHLWVWRKSKKGVTEVLIQKRSLTKKTHPGMLDISAAGHVDEGEVSINTVKREAKEEIGLELDTAKLLFIVRIRKTNINNGIATVYAYQVDDNFKPTFYDGEVENCHWLSLDELEQMFSSPEQYNFANHGAGYFTVVLERLKIL